MLNVKRLSGLMNGGQHLQSDPAIRVNGMYFGLSLKLEVLFETNLLNQMFWLQTGTESSVAGAGLQ